MIMFLKHSKKDKKDKKRIFWKHRRDYIGEQKKQIPAININAIKTSLKKKYPDFTCYNYNKKGHYLKSYIKSPKN